VLENNLNSAGEQNSEITLPLAQSHLSPELENAATLVLLFSWIAKKISCHPVFKKALRPKIKT